MDNPEFLWIQTRDGSPTLWSNSLGESFRSVKGAFSESWSAFVSPAINYIKTNNKFNHSTPIVGEFGLGPGTNWLLWQLSRALMDFQPSDYFVIEKNPETFEEGLKHWKTQSPKLADFFSSLNLPCREAQILDHIAKIPLPKIFKTTALAKKEYFGKADLWFHDPFGFDVNPEGYSLETLHEVHELLAPNFLGLSYACNRHFKLAAESLPHVKIQKRTFAPFDLKRERLEFFR